MYNYTVPQILASVLPGVACDSTINDSLLIQQQIDIIHVYTTKSNKMYPKKLKRSEQQLHPFLIECFHSHGFSIMLVHPLEKGRKIINFDIHNTNISKVDIRNSRWPLYILMNLLCNTLYNVRVLNTVLYSVPVQYIPCNIFLVQIGKNIKKLI